jgi:hypothetical protein
MIHSLPCLVAAVAGAPSDTRTRAAGRAGPCRGVERATRTRCGRSARRGCCSLCTGRGCTSRSRSARRGCCSLQHPPQPAACSINFPGEAAVGRRPTAVGRALPPPLCPPCPSYLLPASREAVVGQLRVWQAMVSKGMTVSQREAFSRKPSYIPNSNSWRSFRRW